VNLNGVFFTAQAAVRQMERLGKPGSIILVASIAGHRHLKVSFCNELSDILVV
jgi:NAD(P)-dependent dehydrogenase (short-subunit alcohol dehydrogenase family)